MNVITHITSAINGHVGVVHLWKVCSHIGIVGNDIADETAVAVSNGQVPEVQQETHNTPSNNT